MAHLSTYFSHTTGSKFNFPKFDLGISEEDIEYIEEVLYDWACYNFPAVKFYSVSLDDTPVNPIYLDNAGGSLGPGKITRSPAFDLPIFIDKDPPTQDLRKIGITEERTVQFRVPRIVFAYYGVEPKIGDYIIANDEEKYSIRSLKPERYFANFNTPLGIVGMLKRERRSSLDYDIQRDYQEATKKRFEDYNKYMNGTALLPRIIEKGIEWTNPNGDLLIRKSSDSRSNIESQGYLSTKKKKTIKYKDPLLYIDNGKFKVE